MKKTYIRISIIFFILVIVFLPIKSLAMTIVLDPGHGGKDSGAISGGIYERDITLKTARYLRDYLKEYNVNVLLTHEGLPSNRDYSVYERAMFARNNNADLLVCLHYNSGTGVNGGEMWVTANKSLHKYNGQMTELGNRILNNLAQLGIGNRGVKTKILNDVTDIYTDGTRADYYGIIRYAMRGTMINNGVRTPAGAVDANVQNGEGIPTILVEHCFMQADYRFIDSDEDIRKIAIADGKAIVEQYGLKKNYPVERVTLNESNYVMQTGESKQLTATIYPDNATNKGTIWSSSNPNIISVDEKGQITAKSIGNATITVTTVDGAKTATANITSCGINSEDTIKMLDTDETKISATFMYTDTNRKLEYTSTDESIVKVAEDGTLTAVKAGKATITVKISGTDILKNIKVEISSLGEGEYLKINNLRDENGYLSGIRPDSKIKDFYSNFEVSEGLEIKFQSENDTLVGTNMKVLVKSKKTGETVKQYDCVLYGDANGDGIINSADLLKIQKHLLNVSQLNDGANIKAADANKDGLINSGDLLRIQKYLLNVSEINW